MPPLITREEALALGELEDHAAIEELIERAWHARTDRFGDSTDLCSLVNAKSGGCAEDCGFCAQSKYAAADRLTEFDRPALLAWGADDKAFRVEWAHRLAERLPQGRVEELPGARTFVMEDEPVRLARLIADFARSEAGAAAA